MRALATGEEFHAAADCAVSPTYVPDLVNASLDLLIDGETGIWHLANRGALSWGELARRAAARGGFDPNRVILDRTDRDAISTALDSVRGSMMPTLDSALDRFFSESEQSWASAPPPPCR